MQHGCWSGVAKITFTDFFACPVIFYGAWYGLKAIHIIRRLVEKRKYSQCLWIFHVVLCFTKTQCLVGILQERLLFFSLHVEELNYLCSYLGQPSSNAKHFSNMSSADTWFWLQLLSRKILVLSYLAFDRLILTIILESSDELLIEVISFAF